MVGLVAFGLACGSPPPAASVDESHPRAFPPGPTRGRLLDLRGEVLAVGGYGARVVHAPSSLAPWVGGMNETDGTEFGGDGLEETFEEMLGRGSDVRVSFDAALHRRLETIFRDQPRAAVAVIDLESSGIRALFANEQPSREIPKMHRATAGMAPPGFTVAPFTALALLSGDDPPPAASVALALKKGDEATLHTMATALDQELLARAQIAFGLGVRTGLWREEARTTSPHDPDPEVAPSPEATADQALGRGAIRFTPLQLARAYATLATGKLAPLSLRADGEPTLDPIFEEEWSRVAPGYVRALGGYAPHLDLVRDALRGALAEGPADPTTLVASCGTATDGAGITFGWCAGYGGDPAVAFAMMAEGATAARMRDLLRALLGEA